MSDLLLALAKAVRDHTWKRRNQGCPTASDLAVLVAQVKTEHAGSYRRCDVSTGDGHRCERELGHVMHKHGGERWELLASVQELAEARRAALEEAATIADEWVIKWEGKRLREGAHGYNQACVDIAAEIRALKP